MRFLLASAQTQILGLVYSQSDIISKEVLLVEALGKSSTRMKHMNAIVFCRPTTESIRKLVDELRDPKYNEYYICTFAAGGRASGLGTPPEWSDTPHLRVRNRAKPSADFSNIVRSNVIEQLAEADQTAVVKEVQVRTALVPPSFPPSLVRPFSPSPFPRPPSPSLLTQSPSLFTPSAVRRLAFFSLVHIRSFTRMSSRLGRSCSRSTWRTSSRTS